MSVGFGQLYAHLLGQVEEALVGDSAPLLSSGGYCVFFVAFLVVVAQVGSAQVVEDGVNT